MGSADHWALHPEASTTVRNKHTTKVTAYARYRHCNTLHPSQLRRRIYTAQIQTRRTIVTPKFLPTNYSQPLVRLGSRNPEVRSRRWLLTLRVTMGSSLLTGAIATPSST